MLLFNLRKAVLSELKFFANIKTFLHLNFNKSKQILSEYWFTRSNMSYSIFNAARMIQQTRIVSLVRRCDYCCMVIQTFALHISKQE